MGPSFSAKNGLFASVDCTDWDHFRHCFREVLKRTSGQSKISDRFIFRGQSCSSWSLNSSFDRANDQLSPAARDQKYAEQIRLFRNSYSVYGHIGQSEFSRSFEDFAKLTEDEIEAIAQHYGLPTRLLDWSQSVYVAAFFAFSRSDLCQSGKVSIWSLDIEALTYFSKSEISLFRDFYRGNVRNLWQMGAFVRNHTSINDLSDLFKKSSKSYDQKLSAGPPALIRFDFPAVSENEVIDDLQMMRINSMTIFPGIEGVVRWIQRKTGTL